MFISLDIPPSFQDEICHIAENRLPSIGKSSSKNQPSDRRNEAIRIESLRLGAAIGGQVMWNQLMATVQEPRYQNALDSIFNFNYLKFDWNTLPPVIETAEESVKLEGNQRLVTADQVFKIIKPARLITATPTWRAYFDPITFNEVQPTHSLLPANGTEATIWREGLCEGAKQGVKFAADKFAEALSKLTLDYKGMLIFKQLVLQGMVNPPKLVTTRDGTVLDNDTLVINKTKHTITNQSRFQQPRQWERPQIQVGYTSNFAQPTPAYIQEPVVLEPQEVAIIDGSVYATGQVQQPNIEQTIQVNQEICVDQTEPNAMPEAMKTEVTTTVVVPLDKAQPASTVFAGFLTE